MIKPAKEMSQRQVVVSAPTSDFINWRNAALLAVSKASFGFWGGVFPAIALELPCTMRIPQWFGFACLALADDLRVSSI